MVKMAMIYVQLKVKYTVNREYFVPKIFHAINFCVK